MSSTRRWSEAGPDGILDGTLQLRAYPVPPSVRSEFRGFPYAAGMLSTEKSHQALYGYWEVALRIGSLGKGHHFALWLLPQDDTWPPGIDMLEIAHTDPRGGDGPLSQWYNNAHGSGRGLEVDTVTGPRDWHTVGFEWTKSTMRCYYGGVLIREQPNYVNKPMYFLATWEIGGKWPGDPNSTTPWPAQVELDYVRYFAPSAGANQAGAPPGYTLAWKDDFNTPSIGVGGGKNFAPYFVDWNVRHLASNEDEAIKVANGEPARSGTRTYGEVLASTGLYGQGPFFHHYTTPQAGSPSPAPSPTPSPSPTPAPAPSPSGKTGTLTIVASGEPDGGSANNGPYPRFDLLVDGNLVRSSIAVTADKDKGQWQTIELDTGLDLAKAKTVAVRFTNDWANWKAGVGVINGEDRNLWIDKIIIAGKSFEAENGIFRYPSGGTTKGSELLATNGTLELDIAGKLGPGTTSAAQAAKARALDLASVLDERGPISLVQSSASDPIGAGEPAGASFYRPDLDTLLA